MDEEADPRAIFAELFRVVRPGGHVALQEWSRSGEEPVREHLAALQAVGFGEVRVVSVGESHVDDSTVVTLVRTRLEQRLEQNGQRAERVLDGSGTGDRARAAARFARSSRAVLRERAAIVHDGTNGALSLRPVRGGYRTHRATRRGRVASVRSVRIGLPSGLDRPRAVRPGARIQPRGRSGCRRARSTARDDDGRARAARLRERSRSGHRARCRRPWRSSTR